MNKEGNKTMDKRLYLCTGLLCGMFLTATGVQAEEASSALNAVADKSLAMSQRALGSALGEKLPDWAKRVEVDIGLNEDFRPTGSILTVQPLYQDADRQNTFFTQLSYLNYEQFDDRKNTTNVGFGYRRVFLDNSLLLGGNVFYDREWDEGHERVGLGAEVKMAMVDFTANYYDATSGSENISAANTEKALDGFDLELRSQVPYAPWARAGVGYYMWEGEDFDDVKGVKVSLDMDITPNLGIEVGLADDDDDTQDTQVFANLTFSFGNSGQARPLSDNTGTYVTHGFDDQMFVMRDMREHTLNKVRRQNKIVTERNSSGITISRAN